MSHSKRPSTDADSDEREKLIKDLERLQQSFEQRALVAMADPLVQTSLTMQQLKVLAIVAIDKGRATAQVVATRLSVSVATVSGIIDRLVDHGMMMRTEDPGDRRVRRLVVTDEGTELITTILSSAGGMPTPVLRRLDVEDLRALVRGVLAIERVANELMAEHPESGTAD